MIAVDEQPKPSGDERDGELAAVIADTARALEAARAALSEHGLLLLSDAALPSLVGIIIGQPLRGSWWGHPLGGTVYRVSNLLEDDPEILATKLVAGKVTYIHRNLWPAVLAVGNAREAWQLVGLSSAAVWLLTRTTTDGEVQTNDLPLPPNVPRKAVPRAARELERRLLVHATEIHTPTGAHAKVLESWPHWAARTGYAASNVSAAEGRRLLEEAAQRLSGATGYAELPWLAVKV